MKKRFIPYLLILCLVITMIPFATIEVSAASNGTADAMVSAATKVAGKSKSSIVQALYIIVPRNPVIQVKLEAVPM